MSSVYPGEEIAPDGSTVRPLVRGALGSMAYFTLHAGCVTRAVRHLTVEELWHVTSGAGELWLRTADGDEQLVELAPGTSAHIAPATSFQFRAESEADLVILGVTMPPWPGDAEATFVDGRWATKP